jgi:hypothetical protein
MGITESSAVRCQCLCECGSRADVLIPLRLEIGISWCSLQVCPACHAEAQALQDVGLFGERHSSRVA